MVLADEMCETLFYVLFPPTSPSRTAHMVTVSVPYLSLTFSRNFCGAYPEAFLRCPSALLR